MYTPSGVVVNLSNLSEVRCLKGDYKHIKELGISFFKKEKHRYRVYRGCYPNRVLLGEVISFSPGHWYFFPNDAPGGCMCYGITRLGAVNSYFHFY